MYVFFISFLIALLEAPALFYFFGPCKRLRDQLIDDLGFGKGWVRGVLYILLSILCYVPKPSIALMAGKSAYRHTCEMVLGCQSAKLELQYCDVCGDEHCQSAHIFTEIGLSVYNRQVFSSTWWRYSMCCRLPSRTAEQRSRAFSPMSRPHHTTHHLL